MNLKSNSSGPQKEKHRLNTLNGDLTIVHPLSCEIYLQLEEHHSIPQLIFYTGMFSQINEYVSIFSKAVPHIYRATTFI